MSDFDGKVAIVTGGGSGLGEAISKELATKGARVIVSDINTAGAERVTQEITDAGGTASAIEQDTARPADSEKVVRHAVDTYGGLHLAVNNAGIGGPQAPAGETDLETWDKVIGINLNGVLYGMRYQIPAMLSAGAERCRRGRLRRRPFRDPAVRLRRSARMGQSRRPRQPAPTGGRRTRDGRRVGMPPNF